VVPKVDEVSQELSAIELEICRLRKRYREPIVDATIDRSGRPVLVYPVTLDRVGYRAHALQYIPVKTNEDKAMWQLLTKEAELLKKYAGYLEDLDQER